MPVRLSVCRSVCFSAYGAYGPFPFVLRTRKGRCPIEQRGEFPSVRASERTNKTNERPPKPLQAPAHLQAPAPRPLDTRPRPQPPCSRPPATPLPPRPHIFLLPMDGRKFPPLFYRLLSPLVPLPCLNISIEKRRPRASNGQQYPLPCCAHFRLTLGGVYTSSPRMLTGAGRVSESERTSDEAGSKDVKESISELFSLKSF